MGTLPQILFGIPPKLIDSKPVLLNLLSLRLEKPVIKVPRISISQCSLGAEKRPKQTRQRSDDCEPAQSRETFRG